MAYSHSRHKASSHPKGPAVIGCYHAVTSPCSVSLSPSGEMMACIYCGLQFAVIWMCMASFPGCDTSIMWLWSGEGSTRPVWTARLSAARCWCSVTDGTRVCRSRCVATQGKATRLDRFPACRQIWNSATWEDATLRNPLAGYWSTQKKTGGGGNKGRCESPKTLTNTISMSADMVRPSDFFPPLRVCPVFKTDAGYKRRVSASLQMTSDSGLCSILQSAIKKSFFPPRLCRVLKQTQDNQAGMEN